MSVVEQSSLCGDQSLGEAIAAGWSETVTAGPDDLVLGYFGAESPLRRYPVAAPPGVRLPEEVALPAEVRGIRPGSVDVGGAAVVLVGDTAGTSPAALLVAAPETPAVRLPEPPTAVRRPYAFADRGLLTATVPGGDGTVVGTLATAGGTVTPVEAVPAGFDPDADAVGDRLIHLRPGGAGAPGPTLVHHDLGSGSRTVLLASARGTVLRRARLSPDGRRVACLLATAQGPELLVLSLDSGSMSRPLRVPGGGAPCWAPGSDRVALVTDHWPRRQVLVVDVPSGPARLHPVDGMTVGDVAFLPDGTLAVLASTVTTAPAVHRLDPADGRARTLLRPGYRTDATVTALRIPAGEIRVPTILAVPVRPPRGVVVMLHGGPAGAWHENFSPFVAALVAGGLAVALVNPRGSSVLDGGLPPLRPGRFGVDDVADVAGVCESLRADGPTAGLPVILFGHSYGGFLAYRAAALFAGVSGLVLSSAYTDPRDLLGSPDRDVRRFVEHAWPELPTGGRAGGFPVPALVVHGEHDRTLPLPIVEQAYGRESRPDSTFRVLPGEGHAVRTAAGLRRLLEVVMRFIEERV